MKYVIGLDYGTECVNAIIVNAMTGETIATATKDYPRWKKGLYCNPRISQWRQHPKDYLEVLESSVHDVLSQCTPAVVENVVGIAFDTTGSTPCFVDEAGMPLALYPEFAENPNAMFILWKDHTAASEAKEIQKACSESRIDYSKYEGGVYSAEWIWAKAIHVLREDDAVAYRAYSIVECCEWLPAVITGVKKAKNIIHSVCAAGHKAMWHSEWGGLPPEEFFVGLEPKLAGFRDKLASHPLTADKPVGRLSEEWAERLGLSTDVVVAGGAYNSHTGAVGAGVSPHTLVRVVGASTCDVMVASPDDIGQKCIKGICGQVHGSVLPGMIGLEAGMSSFGDVFTMFRKLLQFPLTEILPKLLSETMEQEEIDRMLSKATDRMISCLSREAEKYTVAESTMVATDWINGRRSPNASQSVSGTISGFTFDSNAPKVFRSLVEATAYASRAIVECFESQGIEIHDVIAIGDIPMRHPFIMQVMCDVINKPIRVSNTNNSCALGAAMIAATAAGIYNKVEEAVEVMNSGFYKEFHPISINVDAYSRLYQKYKLLGEFTEFSLHR